MICDNTGFHRGPIWKKNSEIKMIKERTFIVHTFSRNFSKKKTKIFKSEIEKLNLFQKLFLNNYEEINK